MADQKLGLPVRSEVDGTDARVQVKIVDFTTPAQGQVVDTDGNSHSEVHGNRADDAADVALRLSELGNANTDGLYHVDDNSIPASAGLIAHSRNVSPAATQQTERLTSIQDSGGTVRALDISLHDELGEAYGLDNPLPVSLTESEGVEIIDYQTDSAVAVDASANHDYVVTALKTLLVDRIIASASSRSKVEVQVEDGVAAGTYTSFAVGFGTSANPVVSLEFHKKLKIAAGVNIRLIRTNRDNQAQDLYSTIVGVEI